MIEGEEVGDGDGDGEGGEDVQSCKHLKSLVPSWMEYQLTT
jgi:hypothetical protein